MRVTEVELRRRWAQGQPAHGVWSLLPGAVTGELLAATGADYVVLDLQHGAPAEADLPGLTAAISAAGALPLVRTRSAHFADIGRPLDLGARGVFVPNVRSAEHAREVVAACRYAPAGNRSIGQLSGGADSPLVLIVLETAGALDELDAVLAVDGLDGIYVGPSDLALSLGRAGDEVFMRETLSSIVARAVAAGKPVGVHAASGADAARWGEQGATILTAAVDTTVLTDAVRRQLGVVRASGAASGGGSGG